MKEANRILAGAAIAIALFTFFWSNRFPDDAAFWPKLFSIVLILLSIGLFLDSYTHPKREEGFKSPYIILKEEGLLISIILGSSIIYLILMIKIGFFLTTPIYLAGILWYLGYRSKKSLILLTCLTTIVIIVIFQKFLHVPLPQGILQDLSIFYAGGIF